MGILQFKKREGKGLNFFYGRNLIQLIKEIKLSFAKAEDAGGYQGLYDADLRQNFLSHGNKKAALLGCEYKVDACWSFLIQIQETS